MENGFLFAVVYEQDFIQAVILLSVVGFTLFVPQTSNTEADCSERAHSQLQEQFRKQTFWPYLSSCLPLIATAVILTEQNIRCSVLVSRNISFFYSLWLDMLSLKWTEDCHQCFFLFLAWHCYLCHRCQFWRSSDIFDIWTFIILSIIQY